MKKFITLFTILLSALVAKADHITGGEMYYTFLGTSSNGDYRYSVTLKFFMRCSSGRQFYNPAVIAAFNKKSAALVTTMNVYLAKTETLSLSSPNPCISNPPTVCYSSWLTSHAWD